ncbi:MAG: AsmA family protein, partial [Paramuribaculum sp.]|nr:AsmA family protein [Paramuribaculum sp.]
MKLTYKILRTIAVTLLLLAILLPAALYVALATSAVQNYLRHRAQSELTNLLGAEVTIDHIAISPFNRLTLHGISVANPDSTDSERPNALTVRRLGAGINIWNYLAHDRIVLNYAEIIGLDAKIYRDSAGAPLNIQPIIDALAPKDPSKPPTRFDLAINTVVLRASSVSYDVGRDSVAPGRFDPKHIAITSLNADLQLPRLSNDTTEIDLRTLTLTERSGFSISSMSALCDIRNGVVDLSDLSIFTPTSYIGLNNQQIDTHALDRESIAYMPVDVRLTRNSHITTTDLAYFIPALSPLNLDFRTTLHIDGTPDQLTLQELELLSSSGVSLSATGYLEGLITSDQPSYQLPRMELKANGANAAEIVNLVRPVDLRIARLLANAGTIEATLSAAGTTSEGNASLGLITSQGLVTFDSDYRLNGRAPAFSGYMAVDELNVASLLSGVVGGAASKISDLSLSANFDVALTKSVPDGSVQLDLSSITYLGHTYTDIAADLQTQQGTSNLSLVGDCAGLHIDAGATLEPVDG